MICNVPRKPYSFTCFSTRPSADLKNGVAYASTIEAFSRFSSRVTGLTSKLMYTSTWRFISRATSFTISRIRRSCSGFNQQKRNRITTALQSISINSRAARRASCSYNPTIGLPKQSIRSVTPRICP